MKKTRIEKIINSRERKEKFCLSLSVEKKEKEKFFRLIKKLFPGETPSKIFNEFIKTSNKEMEANRDRILRERQELKVAYKKE